MKRTGPTDSGCPVLRSLRHVGDAWSFLILRDALAGATRFDEFQRNLEIAPNILTNGWPRWSNPVFWNGGATATGPRATNTISRSGAAISGPYCRRCLSGATSIWRRKARAWSSSTGRPASRPNR